MQHEKSSAIISTLECEKKGFSGRVQPHRLSVYEIEVRNPLSIVFFSFMFSSWIYKKERYSVLVVEGKTRTVCVLTTPRALVLERGGKTSPHLSSFDPARLGSHSSAMLRGSTVNTPLRLSFSNNNTI